jgi:hypothetical protein
MFAHSIAMTWMVWSLVTGGGTLSPCDVAGSRKPTVPPIAERIGPCIVAYDLGLTSTLEQLWHGSPTYRRQCEYLAAQRAIVSLKLDPRPIPHGHRAFSVLGRLKDGRLVVQSRLGAGRGPLPELIAHELEHALEFAEGIDYRVAVMRRTAWVSAGGQFETRRADDAGRRAVEELRHKGRVLVATADRVDGPVPTQCGP